MFVRAQAGQRRRAHRDGHARAARRGRGPPRLAAARLHAPAARPARLPVPPPARLRRGCSPATASASRPSASAAAARTAARRRRAGRRELRHRPRDGRRGARLRRPGRRTRSTRSPTATSSSTSSSARRPARRTSRGSARRSSCGPREEFGFCVVDDAWASGSSIMPQKKNPDAAELLRAKAPRIAAHLVALHGVLHGLPLTYNKDMQEDKEHLFDAADTLDLCLQAAAGMVGGLTFRTRAHGRRGLGRRADRRHRPRRPARQARAAVPRGPRRRRRPRARRGRARRAALGLHRRGALGPLRAARRRRATRCSGAGRVARVEGLRGGHAPRRAWASSSSAPARCWRDGGDRAPAAGVLRPRRRPRGPRRSSAARSTTAAPAG